MRTVCSVQRNIVDVAVAFQRNERKSSRIVGGSVKLIYAVRSLNVAVSRGVFGIYNRSGCGDRIRDC